MRWMALLTTLCLLVPIPAAHGQTAVELEYDAVAPLRLPPDLYLGEVAGVAVNSQGHIFVYSRTGSDATLISPRAASLYEFAPDGTFVREIGGNLYLKAWAHAVRVDADDNLWLVDNGSSMAAKLSQSGQVLQVFGPSPGINPCPLSPVRREELPPAFAPSAVLRDPRRSAARGPRWTV